MKVKTESMLFWGSFGKAGNRPLMKRNYVCCVA